MENPREFFYKFHDEPYRYLLKSLYLVNRFSAEVSKENFKDLPAWLFRFVDFSMQYLAPWYKQVFSALVLGIITTAIFVISHQLQRLWIWVLYLTIWGIVLSLLEVPTLVKDIRYQKRWWQFTILISWFLASIARVFVTIPLFSQDELAWGVSEGYTYILILTVLFCVYNYVIIGFAYTMGWGLVNIPLIVLMYFIHFILQPALAIPMILGNTYNAKQIDLIRDLLKEQDATLRELRIIDEQAEAALDSMEARAIPLSVLLAVLAMILTDRETVIMIRDTTERVVNFILSMIGDFALWILVPIAITVGFWTLTILFSVLTIPFQTALNTSILQAVALEMNSKEVERRRRSYQLFE
jgi:hypothetical protein